MKQITDHAYSPALLSSPDYFWNCFTKEQLEKYHSVEREKSDHDALLAITQENKKLFRFIATFVPTVGGWASREKACMMAGMVLAMKPKLFTEIGTYEGRSFIPVAVAMQHLGNGKAIGIDPYSANASTAGESGENAIWWNNQKMHDDALAKFMHYVKTFNLDSYVHLIRKKSDDVDVPENMDILSLDGNHSEQAVRDAERYGPNVRLGGICICDDLHWQAGGVLRAVDALEDQGFKELYRVVKSGDGEANDWNVMQRVRV